MVSTRMIIYAASQLLGRFNTKENSRRHYYGRTYKVPTSISKHWLLVNTLCPSDFAAPSLSFETSLPKVDSTFRTLAEKAATNACYNSEQRFPPPNCHPGTRTTILNKLSSWIDDDSKTTRVFWLHASAGVGK
ncbi:hypothetical protein MPER_07873 [Moniliophthora perniciosa FA553]|nr:hypothetical protein MPER_07873 [Moniliophthora perniciosa FA553]